MGPITSPAHAVAEALDRPTMRSLVVETNDGIIATAGVVEGFAASGTTGPAMVLAALCSMVAGGIALGGGRYAEEVSERDARESLIAEEREQLSRDPDIELRELIALYEAKGLSRRLAEEVAAELTAVDALAAHVDAEHQISLKGVREAPIIIGGAAGFAYTLGALVPLIAILVTPEAARAQVTAFAALAGLVVTSVLLSTMGVSRVGRTLRRTLAVAAVATGMSLLAGWVMHP